MDDIKRKLMEAMLELPNRAQVDERNSLPISEEDELSGLNAMNRSPISKNDSLEENINRAARLANLTVKEDPLSFVGMSGGISKLDKQLNQLVRANKFGDNLDRYILKDNPSLTNRQMDALDRSVYGNIDEIKELKKKINNPTSEISDLWEEAGYSPNQQRRAFERQKIRDVNPGITEAELKQLQQLPHQEAEGLRQQTESGPSDSSGMQEKFDRYQDIARRLRNKNPEDYKHLYKKEELPKQESFTELLKFLKKVKGESY